MGSVVDGPLLIHLNPNLMRKKLTFLFLLSSLFALAQSQRGPILELTYVYVNAGLGEQQTVRLLFRSQESITLFSKKDSINTGAEARDFSISGDDDQGRQVYKNTVTGEVLCREFVMDGGDTFKPCLVTDPMKPMVWTYSSETKRLGKYQCKGATTEFRGRKYLAWYTEDIPVPHGPWKFSGLPGAIVEVHSVDRNNTFTLIKVSTLSDGTITRPTAPTSIDLREMVRRNEKGMEDFITNLKAKMPRGAVVTVNTTGDYNLETDFSDVKK